MVVADTESEVVAEQEVLGLLLILPLILIRLIQSHWVLVVHRIQAAMIQVL